MSEGLKSNLQCVDLTPSHFDLYDGELRAQYRHSVAHFVLTDGSVANPSSHRDSTRYAGIVYLAQVCAREVAQTQADYFSQFFRAGGRV